MLRKASTWALCAVAACGPGKAPDSGDWVAQRAVHGDTTVVRTVSGSVWGEPRVPVIDLRIGTLDGPDETILGQVLSMAPDGAGGIYVFDRQVPALRHYDAEGAFIETVGSAGQGPGEYSNFVVSMAVRAEGRLQIFDGGNARVSVFGRDGRLAHSWPSRAVGFGSDAMVLGKDGRTYVRTFVGIPNPGGRVSFQYEHVDSTGAVVDTIPDPPVSRSPDTNGFQGPGKVWRATPDGSVLVGVNDVYQFELRRTDGNVLRIEREVGPVRLSDEEWAYQERGRQRLIDRDPRLKAVLSEPADRVRPFFSSLQLDEAGRIWVALRSPGRPVPSASTEASEGGEEDAEEVRFIEPQRFDVFESDGTYLGQVHLPERTRIRAIDGDVYWGDAAGDFDETYVVRMRMPLDG